MLTMTDITNNKDRFLDLITELEQKMGLEEGSLDNLKEYLSKTDFFFAPGSTQYSYSYDGGLCEHCLNVYDIMTNLNTKLNSDFRVAPLDEISVTIVSLFHDLYKINYYEEYVKNKKVYSETGKKSDELGRFDWISEKTFTIKDSSERTTYGSNGLNSYFIISKFINLNKEEATAIINHTSGMDTFVADKNVTDVISKSPLTCLLHMADYMSTFYLSNMEKLPEESEDEEESSEVNE